jgi:hypothetical protein
MSLSYLAWRAIEFAVAVVIFLGVWAFRYWRMDSSKPKHLP